MKKKLLVIITLLISVTLFSQDSIPLYPSGVPNSRPAAITEKHVRDQNGMVRINSVTIPAITIYKPAKEKNKGVAVIICPGGGYSILAATHEGRDVAKKFNEWGITAFVLKYRLPNDAIMVKKSIGPLQDAQRAIQLVKERAAEWNIDTSRIGIMGFSAGGHLASTAATHFNHVVIDNPRNFSVRPAFAILGYPVISFADSITHRGSRNNLIGSTASEEEVRLYSNELQVTPQTPPSFLIHAGDDNAVPVQNSLFFYNALAKNKVPAELHVYPKGGHGFGMINKTTPDQWMDRLFNWMKANGWVE
jgi:acetyl esterase/lipase